MTFESWIYTDSRISLDFYSIPLKVQDPATLWKLDNIEWEFINVTAKRVEFKSFTGVYYRLVYLIEIKRSGNTMMFAILIPGALIAFLGNLYYLLPRGNGERIQYLSSVLLTEIMFLVMITTIVPMAKTIPECGALFLAYTIELSIITVIALLIDIFHRSNDEKQKLKSKILKLMKKKTKKA